jgi:hypothetical protein
VELCEHVSATTKAIADVTLDVKSADMKIVLIRGQDYVKIEEDSQKGRTARRKSLCATRRTHETEKLLSAILLLWLCRTTAGMSTVADALARILALERSKLVQSESEPKRSLSFRQKKADARKSSIAEPASPFLFRVWGMRNAQSRAHMMSTMSESDERELSPRR